MATTHHFVCIGDFHDEPGPRSADRYAALEQIIEAGRQLHEERRLAGWLWPGDLFDALSTTEGRNRLDAAILDMAHFAPVVIAYGNHDAPGDLDGFGNLGGTFPIYVVNRPSCLHVPLATGADATIFVLPYPHKGGLVGAGVATGDVVDTAADLLEPIFMQAADEIRQAQDAGNLVLMTGHVNVRGSETSSGQPNIGREIELNPVHLERLGRIPKILNHIHKPQDIAGAHYVGSVCRMNYGEIEAKFWTELVIGPGNWNGLAGDGPWDGDGRQAYDLVRHPLAVPPMYHIEGVLSRAGFQADNIVEFACPRCDGTGDGRHDPIEGTLTCEACGGSGRRPWAGCDVRVRYRYQASERDVLDEQKVRAMFADALRLKVEGVAIPDRELRAPEVAQAQALPEKVAAVLKVDALGDGLAHKLALLERESRDIVLDATRRGLAAIESPQESEEAVPA